MKRMSEQETVEAFGEFAQKAENVVKPKIARAKGCFFCIIGVFVGLLGLIIFLLQTETMGKVIGLGILFFGLYIVASIFLPFRAKKIAVGLLFILIGAAFAFFGYNSYQLGKQSKQWPSAKGSVIQSEIRESRRTTGTGSSKRTVIDHLPEVVYTYKVDGQSYKSSRITFGAVNKLDAGNTVARYPEGKSIEVFYNPQKPDQAVLEPGEEPTGSLVFTGIGVFLVLAGASTLIKNLKRTRDIAQS